MITHICPICGAAGIADYKKNEVECHLCNSNLKAFLLLNSIAKPNRGRFVTYALIGMSVLAILFLSLFLKSNSDKNQMLASNMVMRDSISTLKKEILLFEEPKNEGSNVAIIKYAVRQGDFPFNIAQLFYGDGRRYKQIEVDNDLKQPYTLKVGQILLIKISQD
jgi:nucleoid-associated protein YgaU